MLFNSFRFLFFFPCVFFLYYALPFRFRKYLLLTASYYFYMCWKPEFIVLILLSTAIDYFCGLGIAKRRASPRAAKGFLALSYTIDVYRGKMLLQALYLNAEALLLRTRTNAPPAHIRLMALV